MNPAYQVDEVEYALQKVGCKGVVASTPFKTQDYYGMLRSICPELDTCGPGRLESKRLVWRLPRGGAGVGVNLLDTDAS